MRAAQKNAALSHKQCAELVCVSEVTWMKWHSGAMVMPCGAWKLFRYEVGLLPLCNLGGGIHHATAVHTYTRPFIPGWEDPREGPLKP